jgi:hypothetical protein
MQPFRRFLSLVQYHDPKSSRVVEVEGQDSSVPTLLKPSGLTTIEHQVSSRHTDRTS